MDESSEDGLDEEFLDNLCPANGAEASSVAKSQQ